MDKTRIVAFAIKVQKEDESYCAINCPYLRDKRCFLFMSDTAVSSKGRIRCDKCIAYEVVSFKGD